MNKTININLAGIIFHLDEEAYKKLTAYLQSIKDRLKGDPGQDEIVTDIEARIAELFQEKLGKEKEVINMSDVDAMMSVMGSPEDYQSDEDEDFASENQERYKHYNTAKTHSFGRKLYRNSDDKVFGGVASGLGAYFGVETVWIRLAWIFLFFTFGSGFLIYIILWMVIPEAQTASQKLQMKGEPINVSNIERSVKNVSEKVGNMASNSKFGSKLGNAIERIFGALLSILKFILKFALKIVGVILVLIGVAIIIGFIGALFGHEIIVMDNMFGMHDITGYVDRTLVMQEHHGLLILGLLLMGVAPIVWLFLGGLNLLFNYKANTKFPFIGSALVSFAGLIIVAYIGFSLGRDFKSSASAIQRITLDATQKNVYYLSLNNEHPFEEDELAEELNWAMAEDAHYRTNVKINIGKSDKGSIFLKKINKSNGRTRKEAKERAKGISYHFEQTDSLILFDDFFKLKPEEKFRKQTLELVLYIPVGTSVFLDYDMEEIIYDIDNVTNTHDSKMLGHTWLMTQNGLVCTDCSDKMFDEDDDDDDVESFEEDWNSDADELEQARKELEIEKQRLEDLQDIERMQQEIEELQRQNDRLEKKQKSKSNTNKRTKFTQNTGFHTPLYILPVNSPLNVVHNQSYVTQV